MISGVKKIPILRYGLIVSLVVVLFGSAFYLYLHYNKAEKVRSNFQKMISARENSSLIDSCIVELYSADNSSRMYALTADKKYFNKFSTQLNNIHSIIGTINANNRAVASGTKDDTELGNLVSEKTLKTDVYLKLMYLTDSLMRSANKLNGVLRDANNNFVKQPVVKRIKTQVHIDTINAVVKNIQPVPPRKKFFGRLFSAFNKKKDEQQAAIKNPILVQRTTDTTITTMRATPKVAQIYNNYYSKIYDANNKLRKNEREMLEINNRLIDQIIGSLKKYKVAEQQYIANSKQEINSNLATVMYEFRKLSGLMFLLLSVVVGVIFYNIWKIFRNEKEMVVYTEMTENYALSKSRFMASMSHEIRTPLNSIIGFSEQLTQSNLTETQAEQTNAIRSSSKMLLEVVNEILDFSKYETGKMTFEQEPFRPYDAIDEIANSMQVQAGKKNIELITDLKLDKDLCFKGDYFRLKQVIMNLTGNAIKFTNVGSVTINAFVTDMADGKGVLNVQVKDTGLGIDKEHLPLIFDEFSQVASAQKAANYGGTGLGLTICKKIVELQGGTIKVTSKIGKGSVFSFKLPMELGAMAACKPKVVAEVDPYAEVAGKHILIAEDNKLNVLLVSTILKKWKITFDIAYNGREALQLFEDNKYDIILTDIEMPEMGGIEFTQMIRAIDNERNATIPILALTANVLKEDRDRYLAVGMTGVVLKPFSEKNLIDGIATALAGKINTGTPVNIS
ncbi:ATP-binding protein [Mucilaginibacter glaciei]|uniref:histidine kinase n=1 Tax=Mucilaginibacter glaciei TaxID=2772109 RepID=A0A926NK48_9SPHI|nr:ATP-binding protein [Mucilaginibacter glaciei]MBD1392706.1 response regulator [Mucilaginibacter glaciei]